ncbi:MAG: cupin domain-containing protein [Alphaproteobacteria bacterium]|nr:cupin domain-containing protein [Alphaproteobacteria bacterium]MDP6517836.1 cupin domain-containing protein [Alphaproteobacteria bacterium]
MAAPAQAPRVLDPMAYDWNDVPIENVMAGIRRKVITGENAMLVMYFIADGTVFSRHNHPHEQFAYILEGTFRMDCDNGSFDLGPGSVIHVPSGAYHGGRAVGGDVVEVDIFSPIREDYLPRTT